MIETGEITHFLKKIKIISPKEIQNKKTTYLSHRLCEETVDFIFLYIHNA